MADRMEHLWTMVVPILVNWLEWKNNPEYYVPGTNIDSMLAEWKVCNGVTDEEWVTLLKKWSEIDHH